MEQKQESHVVAGEAVDFRWVSLNSGVAVAGEDGASEGDVIHRSFDEIPAKRRRIVCSFGVSGGVFWFLGSFLVVFGVGLGGERGGKGGGLLAGFAAGRNMGFGSGGVSELPENKRKEKEKGFLGVELARFLRRNSSELVTDKL
ncbi:hypothetical protein H5410_064108 [Solanum commersonii]|uniref:Uncharacterized protein n=1 Tax=Solanum commersonii TaxID=4109 RepID=A0A9J5W0H5_SOLCO|nr:hypothetical protein H5410_064108 [Solanum commersonii]